MTTWVATTAALGVGGLGQHARQVVERLEASGGEVRVLQGSSIGARGASRRSGALATYPKPPGGNGRVARRLRRNRQAFLRQFDGWTTAVMAEAATEDTFVCFAGETPATLRAVRRRGLKTTVVAATVHAEELARHYRLGHQDHPLEKPWLTSSEIDRLLASYRETDEIEVASLLARDSFLRNGLPAAMLRVRPIAADQRFACERESEPSTRNFVCVGSLTVAKGVPYLVEAFTQHTDPDLRLQLVGGYRSRGMRRYLDEAVQRDRRITFGPGDPVDALRTAERLIHPSLSDGYGLAVAEALLMGVPVTCSTATGAREHVAGAPAGHVIAPRSTTELRSSLDLPAT